MKIQIESDFVKQIKGEELHRVYLLYGAQPYLIGLYEKQLIKKALGGDGFSDFNLHRFQGDTLDLQAFYDAVESLPFFAGSRCVTLDLDPDKLDAGQVQELCGVLADPPATTTVILTVKTLPTKKEKLNALLKVCDKAGCVVELGTRRGNDTLRFLRDRAQKSGCALSSETASYLMERCGEDMQLLDCELQKVCAYVGCGEISREDIDAVVTVVLQARVFDLSKAIFRGNFSKAMELVDQLIDLREPAGKVLAVLSSSFVDLYRGYTTRQANVPAAQAAADFGYAKNREFLIKNAMADSGGYTAPQIGALLEVLAAADSRLKSTGGSDRVILEEAIAKLFLIMGKR